MTTRTQKTVDANLRKVLAENIRRLMLQHYPEGGRLRQLARDSGTSVSTLQRVLDADTGASLDTIAMFAKVFRLPAYKLLIKADEMRFFIDAREVAAAQPQQREIAHTPGHRGEKIRRG